MKARTGWIVATAVAVVVAAGGTTAVVAFTGDDDAGADLRVGSTSAVTSLDPAGAYDAGSWDVQFGIYQRLLTFQAGSDTPQPDAARKCGFEGAGNLRYVCDLREGLVFSNGEELTAEDVKWSIDRTLRLGDESGVSALLSTVEKVRAPSATRVVIDLKSPDVKIPLKLATVPASILSSEDAPAKKIMPESEVPIGSGAYTVAEPDVDDVHLVKNERYLAKDDVDNGGVRIIHYTDLGKVARDVERGKIDVTKGNLEPKDINRLSSRAKDGTVRMYEGVGASIRILGFNVRKPGLDKETVRQAAAYLLDQESLAGTAHQDTVKPLYSLIPQGVVAHGTPFFDAYDTADQDPVARAKEVMAQADVTGPVPITLSFGDNSVKAEPAAIKEQLERGGLFEVTLKEMPFGDLGDAFAKGDYDAFLSGWQADYPDPDTFTTALLVDGGYYNTGADDKRIDDDLVPKTQAESVKAASAQQAYAEMDQRNAESAVLLPLWQSKNYLATGENVVGGENSTDPSGIFRYWKLKVI